MYRGTKLGPREGDDVVDRRHDPIEHICSVMSSDQTPISFRRFIDQDEAMSMSQLLKDAGFNAIYKENISLQDALFIGAQQNYYHVLLPQSEFESAEAHLAELAATNAGDLDPDHYLRSFSTDELKEILRYADDWSAEDVQYARSLLQQQGIEISDESIELKREAHLGSLSRPASRQWTMIILGYFFAAIGGVLGIVLGLILNTQKKILPNGEKVYYYDPRDRRHGFNIFVLSVFILVGLIIIRMMRISS